MYRRTWTHENWFGWVYCSVLLSLTKISCHICHGVYVSQFVQCITVRKISPYSYWKNVQYRNIVDLLRTKKAIFRNKVCSLWYYLTYTPWKNCIQLIHVLRLWWYWSVQFSFCFVSFSLTSWMLSKLFTLAEIKCLMRKCKNWEIGSFSNRTTCFICISFDNFLNK